MAKNDHAHSLKLVQSIRLLCGDHEAQAFSDTFRLSKSADATKKFRWAQAVCACLEEHYDTEMLIRIRKGCRCNDGKTIADKLSRYLKQASSIESFVKTFNEQESFANIRYISDHKIQFCYPQCYCACVKRIPEKISKIWCYCTLGNAEAIFKEVFQKDDIKVALLESIKTGGKQCTIEVEW